MPADADLSQLASLMTGHRASILLSLLGGNALTATEIAGRAGISPSLASSHLAKLLDAGLIAVRPAGKRRHYRLASAEFADLLEHMLTIAPVGRAEPGLRAQTKAAALARGRTCYDHLAGRLGVSLTRGMTDAGLLTPGPDAYELTVAGRGWLSRLGHDADDLASARRAFARPCLDWTERQHHLAGALGAAIAQTFLARSWVVRLPSTRAVRVTPAGEGAIREVLGLTVPA